jgi:hypothetical protein
MFKRREKKEEEGEETIVNIFFSAFKFKSRFLASIVNKILPYLDFIWDFSWRCFAITFEQNRKISKSNGNFTLVNTILFKITAKIEFMRGRMENSRFQACCIALKDFKSLFCQA